MSRVLSFFPPHVAALLGREEEEPAPGRVRRCRAAMLLCDIAGFTALTEKLQRRGAVGAEEITRVIDAAFRPAIRALDRQGGSIVSFGGDALLTLFFGPSPVRRAIQAARDIEAAFRRRRLRTSVGTIELSVSQVVHYGGVEEAVLASGHRRHWFVGGEAVRYLAALELRAKPGLLVVSREARARARRRAGACPPPSACYEHGTASEARLRSLVDPALRPLLGRFEGEFRDATVAFFETAGGARAAMRFFTELAGALDDYGGVLLKTDPSSSGTKWLCLFGVPRAREEDPERAVRTALRVMAKPPRSARWRAALHAGTLAHVCIGATSRRTLDVMGDTVNTAARALGLASWGEVVVSDEVRRRVSALETDSLGAHHVKGKERPLAIHRAVRMTDVRDRPREAASLVGRDRELALLTSSLLGALGGRSAVVAITGEAGIGKSRLAREVALRAEELGFEVAEGRARAFSGELYGPLRDLLGVLLARARDLSLSLLDTRHLLQMMGQGEADAPQSDLDVKTIRLNEAIALKSLIEASAKRRPLLVVLDDLQWSDELTRAALDLATSDLGACPLVVLLLHRPGFAPPPHAAVLALRELSPLESARVLRERCGVLPPNLEGLAIERSGGNPFFIEEVVRHLREAGPDAPLPGGIESLVEARLDRLEPSAKRLAQTASVVGRSFSIDVLESISEVAAGAREALAILGRSDVVIASSTPGHYLFKHALLRDVAYGTILSPRRRSLHRAVARALASLHGEASMLAHHWEMGGALGKARELYLSAARQAAQAHAFEEAERLYRSLLRLSRRAGRERVAARLELGERVLRVRGRVDEARQELEAALGESRRRRDVLDEAKALVALGNLDRVTARIAEAEERLRRAIELARSMEERPLLSGALEALANVRSDRGRLDEAKLLYEEALAMIRSLGDRRSEGRLLQQLGSVWFEHGRISESQSAYQEALQIHREVGDLRFEAQSLGNLGNLEIELGRLEQALLLYERAVDLARQVGDRRTEANNLGNRAMTLQMLRRLPEARDLYEVAIAIHRRIGDRRNEALFLGNLACLCFEEGRVEQAKENAERALAIHRDVANRRAEAFALLALATTDLALTEDVASASQRADEARRIFEEVGDELEAAEALCKEGHIALAMGKPARSHIASTREIAARLGMSDSSRVGHSIAGLLRAQQAFDAGLPLVLGLRPEDCFPGVLRWLAERGRLPEGVRAPDG